MVRKLVRIGNSYGVTLPKNLLKALDMETGLLVIEPDLKGKRIGIRKKRDNEW